MTQFLTRLIQRQSGEVPVVQPRQPSLYAMPPEHLDFSTGQRPDETEAIGYQESGQSLGALQQPASDRPEAAPRAIASEERQAESRGARGIWRLEPSINERSMKSPHVSPAPLVMKRSGEIRSEARGSTPLDGGMQDEPSRIDPKTEPLHRMRDTGQLVQQDIPPTIVSRESMDRIQTTVETPPARLAEPLGHRPPNPTTTSAPPSLASLAQSNGATGSRDIDRIEPSIEVTIGSIEVSAVTAAPAPKRKTAARQPSMSLQDYLARRQGKGVPS